MTRKQMLLSQMLMFGILLSIMGWCRLDEKHDVATLREEQRTASREVLSVLTTNDNAARTRSKGINERLDKLITIVDVLTRELVEGNKK